MVLGGIILLMIVSFNGNITENAALQTFHTTVQSNLTTVTNIFEKDLRLLGYRITDTNKVSFADTSKIVFKEDFDDNGTVDSITYYLGTTRPPKTTNPRVRILYRQVNANGVQQLNLGVTRFRLWYYDVNGNVASIPSKIRTIKVAFTIESPQPIIRVMSKASRSLDAATLPNDTTYSGAYWERTIRPRNLN